jgi:hypothetical protein
MRNNQQINSVLSASAISLALLGLVSTAGFLIAADIPQFAATSQVEEQPTQTTAIQPENPSNELRSVPPAEKPASVAPERPAAIVLDNRGASGLLGREVRSAADENMGRIVDVIVDQSGQVRAAIIDFGGFLGVGSRKIAVNWNALHFPLGQERNRVFLEFTRDQVKAAPEYQEGKPVVVLGASARSDRVRLTTSSTPER